MAASLNRVFLMGNLTRDPELRQTQSGKSVCEFTIAVNEKYGGNESTTFISCTAWERTAETICQYLTKGRCILIEGKLRQDKYTTKDGQERSKTKVNVFAFQFVDKPQAEKVDDIDDVPF